MEYTIRARPRVLVILRFKGHSSASPSGMFNCTDVRPDVAYRTWRQQGGKMALPPHKGHASKRVPKKAINLSDSDARGTHFTRTVQCVSSNGEAA